MAFGSPLQPPVTPRHGAEFQPAGGRARVAVWTLVAAIVANAVTAALDVVMVVLLNASIDDPSSQESFDRILLRDDLAVAGGVLVLVSYLVAAVAVMVWLTRVYANVEALAPGAKRYSTAWAWAGWIVPIISFFRPKQVVNDVWRASSSRDEPPRWLLTWWLLWVVCNIASGFIAATDPDTVEGFRNADLADAIASLGFVAAGVLAVRVVRRTTQLQEDHRARLPQRGPEFVPQPPRPAGGGSDSDQVEP